MSAVTANELFVKIGCEIIYLETMASSTYAVKNFANLFRSRMAFAYELSELYKPSINRHKDKLIELLKEKAEKASQSEIVHKIRVAKGYYKLEMAPPSSDEMQKLYADLALVKVFLGSGCYKQLNVKQFFLLVLVATEVGLWFYLGETIGKMHLVGYQV